MIIGDITEQGLQRKKRKLMETQEISCDESGTQTAKELEGCSQKMAVTLTELFGRDRQSIRSNAASSTVSTLKKDAKLYKYDVFCVTKELSDISRGNQRMALPKAKLEFRRSDCEEVLNKKIISLFPHTFKAEVTTQQYYYLKASSNKLIKMCSPPKGHNTWNGESLIALCGQGALYIQPVSFAKVYCCCTNIISIMYV